MVETQPASQTVGFLERRCPWVPRLPCTRAIAWSSHTHLVETSGDSSLSTGEGTLALQPSVLMFLLCLLGQNPVQTAPPRGRAKHTSPAPSLLNYALTHVSVLGL